MEARVVWFQPVAKRNLPALVRASWAPHGLGRAYPTLGHLRQMGLGGGGD